MILIFYAIADLALKACLNLHICFLFTVKVPDGAFCIFSAGKRLVGSRYKRFGPLVFYIFSTRVLICSEGSTFVSVLVTHSITSASNFWLWSSTDNKNANIFRV